MSLKKMGLLVLLCLGLWIQNSQAQQTVTITDTQNQVIASVVYRGNYIRDPNTAAWRSTILPGWGQAYNNRWWKLPILYGGFYFIGWLYHWNDKYYQKYLTEAKRKANGEDPLDPNLTYATYAGLIEVKDFYLRNRDLTLFSFFALWGVNIIDAYVDARFYQFDINDDLSFSIKPQVSILSYALGNFNAPTYGFQINIKLL